MLPSAVREAPVRTGFTLLETVVALALILAALAGPFTLATRGVFAAKFARSKLTALNLSQEGLELIRQMRENNVINGYDWRGLVGSCPAGCMRLEPGSYQPDVYTTATGSRPPESTGAPLKFNAARGLYSQTDGSDTPFVRAVAISSPSASQMRVVSTVSWVESGGIPLRVELETVLYNWQ